MKEKTNIHVQSAERTLYTTSSGHDIARTMTVHCNKILSNSVLLDYPYVNSYLSPIIYINCLNMEFM